MKKIYSLITLCLLAAACQQQFVPGSPTDGQPSNIGKTVFYSADDEPLTFLPSVDSSAWTALRSLDERFDACSVPDDLLRRMTTDALVGSAVNYPLNYLIYVYNDSMSAVELIFENSPLHRELASRQDAPAELAELFSESDYGFDIKTDLDDRQLSYTDEMFLEYLISSDRIAGRADAETKDLLRDAVSEKAMQRLSEPDRYSIASVEPLMAIDRAADLMLMGIKDESTSRIGTNAVTIDETTVKTPLGKTIEGLINSELTTDEIKQYINLTIANYPNAIIRGTATSLYNCHSYAWHKNSTDNQVWINAYTKDLKLQLSNYWTRDVFVSCSEAGAIRAYYSLGDHSAIILPNGKYLSKWGSWPLVEHDKEYCPYSTANMQYFKPRDTPVYTLTVLGKTPVDLNETNNTYYISSPLPDLEYEWEVRYMDAEEPKPYELIPENNYNTSCRLICKDYGLFKINVYGKYLGGRVAFGQLNVIAYPQQ